MYKTRRRFSEDQKRQIIDEHRVKGTAISVLARIHDISPITLYQWKRAMKDDLDIDIKALIKENQQLKREKEKLLKKVGELTLSNEVGEDIIEFYKKKILEDQLKGRKSSSKNVKKAVKK